MDRTKSVDGEGGADFVRVTDDADPVKSTEGACDMEGTKRMVAV